VKQFTSHSQKIGQIGEDITCRFLMKRGFVIKERNFTRKYGEIDVIAENQAILHFIEVKTVTRDLSVSHEKSDSYRPEDNLHPWKLKRLSRVIQVYLLKPNIPEDKEWQFDVVVVYLDMERRLARVKLINDIVL